MPDAHERPAPDPDLARFKLDVNLAEYARCFAEISARFTYQTAAFTILAAGIGGIFAFGRLTEPAIARIVCLFAPLFVAPVGYIFFDNELNIWRLARYMRLSLRPRITALTDDDEALGVDGAAFTPSSRRTVSFLSIGRWLVFVIPSIGALIEAIPLAFSALWAGAIFTIDVAAIVLLLAGILAALREQRAWRQLGKADGV